MYIDNTTGIVYVRDANNPDQWIPLNGKDGKDGIAGAPGFAAGPGEPGKDGTPGAPAEGVTTWIDSTTGIIYIKDTTTGEWTPINGKDGKDGVAGGPGVPGKDGVTVPADATIWIDSTTGTIYIKDTTTGDWVKINGNDGKDGLPGGPGVPGKDATPAEGVSIWVDTNTKIVYIKDPASGAWIQISGNNGKDGLDGSNGITGGNGLPGTKGLDGEIKMYIDNTTGIVYVRDANNPDQWIPLNGKDGKDGIAGAPGFAAGPGEPGKDGTPGAPAEGVTTWIDSTTGTIYIKDTTTGEWTPINGKDGKSAFDIWEEIPANNGKTEADYAAAIKGEPGAAGSVGPQGPAGPAGPQGVPGTDAINYTAGTGITINGNIIAANPSAGSVTGGQPLTSSTPSILSVTGGDEVLLKAASVNVIAGTNGQVLTTDGTNVVWKDAQTPTTASLTSTTPDTVLKVTGTDATLAAATVNIVPATVEGQVLTTTGTGTDAKVEWKAPVASNVMGIKVISSDYIVTAADYTVIASHLNSDIKITLPDAASNVGRILVINQIDIESDSGAEVAVKFNTEVIYSDTVSKNQIISDYYSTSTGGSLKVTLQSDGANWYVISFM